MAIMNTATGWGLVARIIHWVMAIMIVMLLVFGTLMSNVITDLVQQFEMVQQHKSIGFTVFVLALIRVIWRRMNPTSPSLPDGMPSWQVNASEISHKLLYVLILAIPLSGWLMASASPLNDPGAYPVQIQNEVFGLFAMPDPFPTGSASLTNAFHIAHSIMTKLLALILLVHIGAALKHHFIDKDNVLRRMIRG